MDIIWWWQRYWIPENAVSYTEKYPGKIFYHEHNGNKNFGNCIYKETGIAEKSSEKIISFHWSGWYMVWKQAVRNKWIYLINWMNVQWSRDLHCTGIKKENSNSLSDSEVKDLKADYIDLRSLSEYGYFSRIWENFCPLPSTKSCQKKYFDTVKRIWRINRGLEDIVPVA